MKPDQGIGATPDLSLRVSVATLVRVVFSHPLNGFRMLALEQKATLQETENGHEVAVRSQPYGGAVRILNWIALQALIGDFHFDSARSRAEQDFRLFIQPSHWPELRAFCIQHLKRADDPVLETSPVRELTEEFYDALKIDLQPGQYSLRPVATVVEDQATPTANIYSQGVPTVRLYRIFEAKISDPSLAQAMQNNSDSLSDLDLRQLALADLQNGGKGRANAVLALPLEQLTGTYAKMPPKERNLPIVFEQHRLAETIPAMLEGISVPKYRRL